MPPLRCAAILLSLPAFYWSLRLAHADILARRETPDEIARAIRLTPGNARLRLDARDFAAASVLNPFDSEAWIGRGLMDDRGGERWLLEAARVDRTFKPQWTLANYYARAGPLESFWPRARACLEFEDRNPEPVFDLCRRVSDDASRMLAAIPRRSGVLASYLRYLLRAPGLGHGEAAVYAALMGTPGPKDAAALLDYCDFLIARGGADAEAPWNAATGDRLDPARGVSLTNGDFAREPSGRGFDWHAPPATGVAERLFRSSSTWQISLDGEQAEHAELLWQTTPLLPGRRYRFQFRYRTSDVPAHSGLTWRIANRQTSENLASDDWRERFIEFETPPSERLARFALRYDRPLGAMRVAGTVSLEHIRLSLLE